MIIIGAGMAGCLAGAMSGDAQIYEQAPAFTPNHKAVFRLRRPDIGRMLGINFKEVDVRKSIWFGGSEVKSSPRFINLYSRKVTGGRVVQRSIMDVEPVKRYIPPANFHKILADMCSKRIHWGSEVDLANMKRNDKIISTMPVQSLAKSLGMDIDSEFGVTSINVRRILINGADVYQTVYYPDLATPIYRASMTGNILTIESINSANVVDDLDMVFESFGLGDSYEHLDSATQALGKITCTNPQAVKHFIYEATVKHNIYSLGRFATWRNILMDDVYDDILKIRQLIELDHYDLSLEA